MKDKLKVIAEAAYKSKLFDLLTYIKTAHMNYVSFLLTIINLAVILNGIVLPALRVPQEFRIISVMLILIIISVIAVIMGWIDVNAGISRKSITKNVYWRKPMWMNASMLTLRIFQPSHLVSIWIALKKDKEANDELKACLRTVAENTVELAYWSYSGVEKGAPLPNLGCLKLLSKALGAELSEEEIKSVEEVMKRPEYL